MNNGHIFDESVFAFILERNLVNFVKHKESNRTRRLVLVPDTAAFFCGMSQYRCGALFICVWVYQSLRSDRRSSLTLFIVLLTALEAGLRLDTV